MTKERAWLEINLTHLKQNTEMIAALLPKDCRIMAVVKANAYGHGDRIIARELNRLGITTFAVATLAEGIHLREYNITGEILILGYTPPSEASYLPAYHLTQTVIDYAYAKELNMYGKPIQVHLKLDTGMHRLGENFHHLDSIKKIYECHNLIITGTYSHLCAADSSLKEDIAFTEGQITHFFDTITAMKKMDCPPGFLHIQSSYGIFNYPNISCDYARPGISLYGAFSSLEDRIKSPIRLQPVLSLKARISSIRQVLDGDTVGYGRIYTAHNMRTIAAVTLGYADGLPRNLAGNKNYVLVNGSLAPMIGRICMDQFMIDVTGLPDVSAGDIVTIIGTDGKEQILAEEISKKCGTITNELFSRLGDRPVRVPIKEPFIQKQFSHNQFSQRQ